MENEAPTKKRLTKTEKMLADLRAYRVKLIATAEKTAALLQETERSIAALESLDTIENG